MSAPSCPRSLECCFLSRFDRTAFSPRTPSSRLVVAPTPAPLPCVPLPKCFLTAFAISRSSNGFLSGARTAGSGLCSHEWNNLRPSQFARKELSGLSNLHPKTDKPSDKNLRQNLLSVDRRGP